MAWYNPRTWANKPKPRPEKTTIVTQPAQQVAPVRAVDTGTPTQARTGGATIIGQNAWKGRGGGGSSSNNNVVVKTSGDLTQEQGESIARSRGLNPVKANNSLDNEIKINQNNQMKSAIAGQNVVSSGGNYASFNKEYSTGLGTAFVRAGRNVGKVGIVGQQGFGSYWNQIFTPFEDVNSRRANINPTWKGTIIADGFVPSGYQDTSKMTAGQGYVNQQVKVGINPNLVGIPQDVAITRIGDNVQKSFQNQINTGKLSYETDTQIAEVNKMAYEQYNKDVNSYLGKNKGAEDFSRFRLSERNFARDVIKAGTETAITSAVFALPEAKILGDIALGRSGIKNGVFAFDDSSYLARQMEKDILKDLGKQRFGIAGKEVFASEKGSAFKIYGLRSNEFATQNIKFNMPVFNTGKAPVVAMSESGLPITIEKGTTGVSFNVLKGKSLTNVYNPLSDTTTLFKQEFGGGGKILSFGSKVRYNGVSLTDESIKSGSGTGYIKLKGQSGFTEFKFGGISKESKELYRIAGGSNPKTATFKIGTEGKVFTSNKRTLFTPIENFGFITRSKSFGSEGFSITNIGSSGTSTGLKSTFKSSATIPINAITEQAGKQSVKSIVTPKISGITPTNFGTGGALSVFSPQKTKTTTKTDYAFGLGSASVLSNATKNLQSNMVSPVLRTPSLSGSSSRSDYKFGLLPKQEIIPKEAQTTRQGFGFMQTPKVPVSPTLLSGFNFPPIAFAKIKPNFDDKGLGNWFKKGNQRYKNTPSFDALLFNIKGKMPKSPMKLALGTRPISENKWWLYNSRSSRRKRRR